MCPQTDRLAPVRAGRKSYPADERPLAHYIRVDWFERSKTNRYCSIDQQKNCLASKAKLKGASKSFWPDNKPGNYKRPNLTRQFHIKSYE